eukprot:2597798-Rhodomonas_salina.2
MIRSPGRIARAELGSGGRLTQAAAGGRYGRDFNYTPAYITHVNHDGTLKARPRLCFSHVTCL